MHLSLNIHANTSLKKYIRKVICNYSCKLDYETEALKLQAFFLDFVPIETVNNFDQNSRW